MSEDTQNLMVAAMAKQVESFTKKTPEQRFQYLVDQGLVDRHGNVTTICGGDAKPEPHE